VELISVCPSAGDYWERMFGILDESVMRYPFDGFFINWTAANKEDY
jgi:hypothetical protein